MRVVVHVASLDEVSAARSAAEGDLAEGDELEVIVNQPTAPRPADRQPPRQAVGYAPQAR